MAEFSAAVYQNEFLADGATDVNAIVTITCRGAGTAGRSGSGAAGEIIIVDTSGSMGPATMAAAKDAAQAALAEIVDGTWFAVVAGADRAMLAYPQVSSGPGMVRMDARARTEAATAISRFVGSGGTAISTWLDLAGQLFASVPEVTQRHVLLLTDGENRERPGRLDDAINRATGYYQADCRGAGTDWQVAEIRRIAQALLGTVDIIPSPQQMRAQFQEIMRKAMSRGVADASLRVWTPQGAQVLFVRQVSPSVEDLTHRRTPVNALTGDYPTGAWADESRDYHVAVRVPAKAVGQEQLAARVQLAIGSDVVTQGLVKATWSSNSELTTRIDQQVAHYTGQTELAAAIQDGLAAKAAGDEATATTKLGRAVQLAAETGNDEATSKLRKVVDIDNEATGTIRLKRTVDKADEMALDTASTKTTRIRKEPS
ncbi:VWA domain-containing protein [Nocardioides sp. zg-536]|uniref:VWA domain-containing protein n=1 Tax=Nocardioides faecalis TaxID=2803858 RepID=A0A939BUT7_9ACTN|nr:VWA domain-containing protein [Nocardioides faecalis]MBM9459221.1 VWA domain-containing protein [Nocardioides faecalis]MBS4751469.1 VWA domain-containing protein [Nocardioides faecalis]QVI59642.1 VWA domain-containing protein [Nocardioides faecalis]